MCTSDIYIYLYGAGEGKGSPFRPARMLLTVMRHMRVRVLRVAEPRWGSTVQLGSCSSGWLGGRGSGDVTSSPAAAICPDVRA